VKNGVGETITIDVPTSMDGLDVDIVKSTYFLENFEKLLRQKVITKVDEIKAGSTYQNYIQKKV
jgi:hypothetical protein